MPQIEDVVTSSSKVKRPYRKGNPLTGSEKQQAAAARKRTTHKKIEIFVRRPLKDQLVDLCNEESLTQGQVIELLIEQESERRRRENKS